MSVGSIALIASVILAGLLWVLGRRDAAKPYRTPFVGGAKRTSPVFASEKGGGLELEEFGLEELGTISPNWQALLKRMIAAHEHLEMTVPQSTLPKLATEIITTSAQLAIEADPFKAELAEHDLRALISKPNPAQRSLITHLLALEERLELLDTVLEEAANTLEGKRGGAHPTVTGRQFEKPRLPKEAELETLAHRLRLLL